ncbi:MAG TPA: hypothetical protein VEB66_06860 [Opitutaceae bacterium]|nr:hypothetical protein [Opitutaceae bacterium]
MKTRLLVILMAGLIGIGGLRAAEKPAPAYDRAEKRQGADFAAFLGEMQAALERPQDVRVLEGLPHPREKELLAREQKSKKVVLLHDGEFYADPRGPDGRQLATMPDLLAGTLSEYAGAKRCGGFHADYAVTWRAGGKDWAVLICYGCGEAAIFGPPGSLKCDLNGPRGNTWREWLAQFDEKRPKAGKG